MLDSLVYALLFEVLEPSYGTLLSALPPMIVAQAVTETSILTLSAAKTPIKITESIGPVIEAPSVFSVDLETGTPLFVKDIFSRRSIASISKLMTAMVILDNHNLDEVVTVSSNAASQGGSRIELVPGEKITVENLLRGLLIASGNDAAVALAEHNAGTEKFFVDKLNVKAKQLGLRDAHFSNAKGFDEEENYSTTYDVMLFSRAALEYPFIRETVGIKKTEIRSVNKKTLHKLESTNELLKNPFFRITGLKTGRTPLAGESFVSLFEHSSGRRILTVVLGSPDRFTETKIILDWITRNYRFEN